MASILGTLRVRLTAETEDFRRGLESAGKNVESFQKSLERFRDSTIEEFLGLDAIVEGIKKSLEAAQQLGSAQDALAASARLSGQSLDTLQAIVAEASSKFAMGKIEANAYALQISRLADVAGGLQQPGKVLESFLNIGAARGMNPAQTLDTLKEASQGNRKAVEELFNRKPTQLYEEFARSIGTTADKLSQQGQAQALVNEALKQGATVRDAYAEWLHSSEGAQFRITQGLTDASTVIGESFQPALAALVPVAHLVSDALVQVGLGLASVIADFQEIPGFAKAAGQALQGDFAGASATMKATLDQWDRTMQQAKSLAAQVSKGPKAAPGALGGRGTGGVIDLKAVQAEAMQRQDILLQDQLEKAKNLTAIELQRLANAETLLGSHETLDQQLEVERQRLKLQLDLSDQQYTLQRNAALSDLRLTDQQRANELLKLDLAKQREQTQLRTNEAVKEELLIAQKQKALLAERIGAASNLVTGILSGNATGEMIGSSLGTIAGSFLPGIGEIIGPSIGGFLGGLFDKKKKNDAANQQPVVKGLDAVERAQRDTITAIAAQTQQLLNPQDRFLNLPSNFNVPAYAPSVGGSPTATYGDTNNNVTVNLNVNGTSTSPDALKKIVAQAVGEVLYEQRRNRSRNPSPTYT